MGLKYGLKIAWVTFILKEKTPALRGAEFKGFALKDRPNPVMTSLGAGFKNHTPLG